MRLETKPEDDWEFSDKPTERAQLWICLGDDRCRNAKRTIKITNRPPALQRIWTRSTRSRVRAQLWQNKSVNIYNMMQGASVLVLSFRCQLVCRFRKTKLLILAAADLNLVVWFLFFFLCCHSSLRYTAVRRQQLLATLLL